MQTLVETKALGGERGAHSLARAIDTIEVPATVEHRGPVGSSGTARL